MVETWGFDYSTFKSEHLQPHHKKKHHDTDFDIDEPVPDWDYDHPSKPVHHYSASHDVDPYYDPYYDEPLWQDFNDTDFDSDYPVYNLTDIWDSVWGNYSDIFPNYTHDILNWVEPFIENISVSVNFSDINPDILDDFYLYDIYYLFLTFTCLYRIWQYKQKCYT